MANLSELIGIRIKEFRKARGLRQEDMERVGLSYKYYQRIEAGKVNLTLKTIEKIADALAVDSIELFSVPLEKSPEINEMAATVSEIIQSNNKKAAKKVTLFIKEFLD
jgi:transcriptional regulator with XRE-family HTH domain